VIDETGDKSIEPDATPEPAPEVPEAVPAAEQAEPETETQQAETKEAPEVEPVVAEEQADAPPAEAAPAEEEPPKLIELAAGARYTATGKRKSAVARVILSPGKGNFELNGRSIEDYFPRKALQQVVKQPLEASGFLDRVDIRARIHGGGISGQADAVRHGISKALIEAEPALRGELKRRQLLTRDPRVKERYKAGLKKARKRPQFSKR